MTLAALIRRSESGRVATAIPATSAIPDPSGAGTVARIATVAVANPEDAKARAATAAEAAELRKLITQVLADCPAEIEETVQTALADVDDALACFRALVADLPPTGVPLPVLPTCGDCRNLTTTRDRDEFQRCMAAGRGELPDVHRRYCPDPTTSRRCLAFVPQPGDPDQRPGAERWPWLADAAISADQPRANAGLVGRAKSCAPPEMPTHSPQFSAR